jgi:hypothetical protein
MVIYGHHCKNLLPSAMSTAPTSLDLPQLRTLMSAGAIDYCALTPSWWMINGAELLLAISWNSPGAQAKYAPGERAYASPSIVINPEPLTHKNTSPLIPVNPEFLAWLSVARTIASLVASARS